MNIRIAALGLLLTCSATSAAAQDVLAAIDSAGRLEVIDRDLARRLDLFTDVPGFREARLFRTPAGGFVLEITHRVDGRLARTRRLLTPPEAEAFRRMVTATVRERARNALLDQDGRGELLRGSFALALGFYGWAIPVAFDVQDDRTAVGVYTLSAGTAFFLPLLATSRMPVTLGQSSFTTWGATRGIFYGVALSELVHEFPTGEQTARWALAGSLAGWGAGFVTAGQAGWDQGTADAIGMFGDFGTGIGLLTGHLLGGFDRDTVTFNEGNAGWIGPLVGGAAGLFAGTRYAAWEPTTRGDVGVFRAATLTGAWAGFAIAHQLDGDDDAFGGREWDKPESWGAIAGAAGGLVLAHLVTRDRDFSSGQGAIVSLGALGGGLFGSGLGYLVTEDDDANPGVFLAGALGSAVGFGVTWAALQDDARAEAAAERLSLAVGPGGVGVRVSF